LIFSYKIKIGICLMYSEHLVELILAQLYLRFK
jgi:hypothetical protein